MRRSIMRAALAVTAAAAAGMGLGGCKIVVVLDDDEPPVDAGPWSPDANYVDAWDIPDAGPAVDAFVADAESAGPNKVTVCGNLLRTVDDSVIQSGANGEPCGAVTTSGPCSLTVTAYDALDYVANPAGAVPLSVESQAVYDTGYFCVRSITRPALGQLALVVDDRSAVDGHLPTVEGFATSSGEVIDHDLHATARGTEQGWTTSAGLTGPGFAERGVILVKFSRLGGAATGVVISPNGGPRPADDFYFDDATSTLQSIESSQARTGPSGAGLLLGSSLVEHTGSGGLTAGCFWPSELAAAIPGHVSVLSLTAVDASDNPCL